MNKTVLVNISIVFLSLAVLTLVDKFHHSELSIERAMEPVKHLSDARHFIVNNKFNSAIRELDEAIMEMRIIEQYSDSVSSAHIEQAVKDLRMVEREIKNDALKIDDLNRAFFNALNSIAYACMMVSERNLDKGEKYTAMRFMNATFAEMIASLKFVKSNEIKAKEEKVIAHVRDILANMKSSNYKYRFSYDTINHELEELIEL